MPVACPRNAHKQPLGVHRPPRISANCRVQVAEADGALAVLGKVLPPLLKREAWEQTKDEADRQNEGQCTRFWGLRQVCHNGLSEETSRDLREEGLGHWVDAINAGELLPPDYGLDGWR